MRIVILALVAAGVVQAAVASEGTFQGIIKRVDDKGFELDIVQVAFPQYYESRLPAIWTGIRDGGFYQWPYLFRYEFLAESPKLIVDGRPVDVGGLKSAVALGRKALVSLDRGDVTSVTLAPWQSPAAPTDPLDGVLKLDLEGAVFGISRARETQFPDKREAALKPSPRVLELRINPRSRQVVAYIGPGPGHDQPNVGYPMHPARTKMVEFSLADGKLRMVLEATTYPTYKEEKQEPLHYTFTVEAGVSGTGVNGKWTAGDGRSGAARGTLLARPDLEPNPHVWLRAMGRFHPNDQRDGTTVSKFGWFGNKTDVLECHFDTIVLPTRDGQAQLAGAEIMKYMEWPESKVNAVDVKLTRDAVSGTITYTAEEGTFKVAVTGVVVGEYIQGEYVTQNAAGKEVKRGLCKGRVWNLMTSPVPAKPAVAVAPPKPPAFSTVVVKPVGAKVEGVKVEYLDGHEGDKVVETLLAPGICHDGWHPRSKLSQDNYRVRWTTTFTAKEAGLYRFRSVWGQEELAVGGKSLEARRQDDPKEGRFMVAEVELPAGEVELRVMRRTGPRQGGYDLDWAGPDGVWYSAKYGPFSVTPWEGMHRRRMVVFATTANSQGDFYHWKPRYVEYDSPRLWIDRNGTWSLMKEAKKEDLPERAATLLAKWLIERYGADPDLEIGIVDGTRHGVNFFRQMATTGPMFATQTRSLQNAAYNAEMGGICVIFGIDSGEVCDRWAALLQSTMEETRRALKIEDLPIIYCTPEPGGLATFHLRWDAIPHTHYGSESWWQLYRQAVLAGRRTPVAATVDTLGFPLATSEGHHWDCYAMAVWAERAGRLLEELDAMGRAAKRLTAPQPRMPMDKPIFRYPESTDPKERLAKLSLELIRATKPRTIEQLGVYNDCYTVYEYKVQRVITLHGADGVIGGYPAQTIQIVHQTIKNKQYTEAYNYKVGDKRDIVITSWKAQPFAATAAMDDEISNVDMPLYYPVP